MEQHIFVFESRNSGTSLKVNIIGNRYDITYDGQETSVDLECLRDGSSTVVLYNPIQHVLYPLYNFREILQVVNLPASVFSQSVQMPVVMQIDKSAGNVFVKISIPRGARGIESDTTDFSQYEVRPVDQVHELDLQFSWQLQGTRAHFDDDNKTYFTVNMYLNRSDFWKEPVYLNYAGQSQLLESGENIVRFKYVPHNELFAGAQDCRYPGRIIYLEDILDKEKNR